MYKKLSLILPLWYTFATAADVCHRAAIARFNHGVNGASALVLASRLNPWGMNTRFTQMETLFADYRRTGDEIDLEEAVLIAGGVLSDFPGNAQAKSAYAQALGLLVTHTPQGDPLAALVASEEAMAADPLSMKAVDRWLFTSAAFRLDYPRFKALGRAGLVMKCDLCGKKWLDHRRK